ncbi:MAG: hypothetical protein ABI837_06060, partial [Acidobacteriota bacterium]
WRETFAEKLRGWGIDAEASRQASRGVDRNYPSLWRKKAAEEVSPNAAANNATEIAAPRVTSPRDERECPFCAEPILKKAKVCKHCHRDVEPLER